MSASARIELGSGDDDSGDDSDDNQEDTLAVGTATMAVVEKTAVASSTSKSLSKRHKTKNNTEVGNQNCEHGRRRSQCKECGGGSICEHGRRRSDCKECGGSRRTKQAGASTKQEVVGSNGQAGTSSEVIAGCHRSSAEQQPDMQLVTMVSIATELDS
jgi:hypothetical protein